MCLDPLLGAEEPALGRGEGAPGEARDFGELILLEVPEDPAGPILRAQAIEDLVEECDLRPRFLGGVAADLERETLVVDGAVEAEEAPETSAPESLVDSMDHDAHEPAAHAFWFAKLRQVSERVHEGVLDHVLDIRSMPEQSRGDCGHPVDVASIERLFRPTIAIDRAGDELRVVGDRRNTEGSDGSGGAGHDCLGPRPSRNGSLTVHGMMERMSRRGIWAGVALSVALIGCGPRAEVLSTDCGVDDAALGCPSFQADAGQGRPPTDASVAFDAAATDAGWFDGSVRADAAFDAGAPDTGAGS